MNDTVLTILALVTFIMITVGVISYTMMTGKIIKDLERENQRLRKQLAFYNDYKKNTETLHIIAEGEPLEDDTDFTFGEF